MMMMVMTTMMITTANGWFVGRLDPAYQTAYHPPSLAALSRLPLRVNGGVVHWVQPKVGKQWKGVVVVLTEGSVVVFTSECGFQLKIMV